MASLRWLYSIFIGPRLFRILKHDNIQLRACWGVSWWTSPFLLATLYVRGIGRLLNDDYMRFFRVLVQATELPTIENKVCRNASDRLENGVSWGNVYNALFGRLLSTTITPIFRKLHTPVTTAGETLNQGRFLLLEEKGGRRAKILTEDSNEIDTMFVDRRHPASRHGNTLVVCFEGNAGYYEIGCCGAPIECGYSVLGWNHPGFAGSSGVPLPEAEQCAIDAVMQYAIHRIGFPLERIALFAWSIGGYSASWAAMNYPGVKHVVLDATFDDLVPLALSQMPDALSGLVRVAMLTHMNLNIADQLMWYPGPIKLIRRYRDEIIATEKTANNVPVLGSNRGNHLLVRLLCHRYPEIVNQSTLQELWNYLQDDRVSRVSVLQQEELSPAECEQRLGVYSSEVSTVYPMLIGEGYSPSEKISMTLFLASKYMVDFDATHCTPLPATFFTPAWSPSGDA